MQDVAISGFAAVAGQGPADAAAALINHGPTAAVASTFGSGQQPQQQAEQPGGAEANGSDRGKGSQ